MHQHLLRIILPVLITQVGLSQELFRPHYPAGLYATKEDFMNKTPSATDEIYPDRFEDLDWEDPNTMIDDCFFKYRSTDKKVKATFAVSYKGYLFFQKAQMIIPRNRNKKDKDQTTYGINAFSRVKQGGNSFFYTETELKSGWESALYMNLGAAGSVAESRLDRLKGIVWDFEKQEFNIFRNCKDLNVFLQEYCPHFVYKCQSKKYDILLVREAINEIK